VRIRSAPNRPRASQRARADFEQFVTASSDALLRTAYLVVWDPAEAEDLVQDCLLAVARRWPRVRGMDHPHAYARRVLINLALDGAQRRTRRRMELLADGGPPISELADESSARRLHAVGVRAELIQALGTLPPRQRAVLVLRYFEDLSEAQVAELLGCSVGTVKSAASRALTRLQTTLTPDVSLSTKEHTR
jgi:RNA polymerase sigma-70 factor (sigma-E family)